MGPGLVLLLGLLIVSVGWLTTGPVARADDDGHVRPTRLKALAERIAKAKITLSEAVVDAEKAAGGSAVYATYELEGKGLEIEVKVLVDNKIKEVEFDAMTGKRLGKDDDDDDDDDHENGDDDDDDDKDDDDGHDRS
jgi:hypothetical protein